MDYPYGSRHQLLSWVLERPAQLNRLLLAESPTLREWAVGIEWLSPEEDSEAELRDAAWQRVGLPEPSPVQAGWWPGRGPVWDGVARVHGRDRTVGALLVEAKGREREVRGSSCRATDPDIRRKIADALADVQNELNVVFEANWLGPTYQAANRLAVLWLARAKRQPPVPVWLVSIYFLAERYPKPGGEEIGPTSEERWRPIIEGLHREMRLPEPPHLLSPWWIECFVKALPAPGSPRARTP